MSTTTKKSPSPARYATHLTTADGRRVYVSGTSKADLAQRVNALRLEMGAGVDVTSDTTVATFAAMWVPAYKAHLRPNSRAVLEDNLRLHVLPMLGPLPIREVKPMTIQAWATSLAGLSVSVQRKCLQIARGIFRAAAKNGLILRSPVDDDITPIDPHQAQLAAGGNGPDTTVALDPADDDSDDQVLTDAQCRALLSAVKGTRAYLFCLIALSTGLRRGEILGLMWEDLDLDAGTLTVRHNKVFPARANDAPVTRLLKSEAAHRTIAIPAALLEELRAEQGQTDSPFVLHMEDGRSLTKASFSSLWRCVTARTAAPDRPLGSWRRGSNGGRLQITLDFPCHPHQLRHTYVTSLIDAGLDVKEVQYLAGHVSPEITLRIYTHYRAGQRMQATHDRARAALEFLTGSEKVIRLEEARRAAAGG